LGLGDEAAVLLFVGRIQRLKGIDVLLRAAAELLRGGRVGRPLQVQIVGGQPGSGPARTPEEREVSRLRELAGALGLESVVRFVGAVPQEQLPTYYRAADAVVMPSSYESFGLVAAEAMACGTPVVASQVGGLRSIVEDGRTGYLIPWRNPTLFAQKLELLLTQPALAAELGRNAAAAMRLRSWSATAERLLAIYRELLAARQAGRPVALAGAPGTS
jgi:D-inositol-3-phosphate glycosyltransferase